jgi:hypothetical protein
VTGPGLSITVDISKIGTSRRISNYISPSFC